MSGIIQDLQTIYVQMRDQMHALASINKEAEAEGREPSKAVEEARSQISVARAKVYPLLREAVWRQWLDDHETPDLFDLYPPKDMPKNENQREERTS